MLKYRGMKTEVALTRTAVAQRVKEQLHEYCLDKIELAEDIGKGYVTLWQEIDAYLAAGGKRIRPYLVSLAFEAYGGDDAQSVLPVACAWELLHAALLIHDDIIDRDTVRHGVPNIAGAYQARYSELTEVDATHFAMSAALLAGDLLLSASQEIVNSSALADSDKLRIQSYLQRAIYAVGGGEFLDFESSLYPIKQNDPLSIALHKTASYSFQLPLVSGASLAKAPRSELKKLEAIGLETGIAFQLMDDLLGVFGDQATTGKSNRTDIFEKKRTLLVEYASQQLGSEQANQLEMLFDNNRTMSAPEAEEVISLLQASGVQAYVQEQIAQRAQRAINIIETLQVGSEYKQALTALVNKATQRDA